MGLRHLVASVVRPSVLRPSTAAFSHRWKSIGAAHSPRGDTPLRGSINMKAGGGWVEVAVVS